jgi:adenine-specific DNA-methyltransferase
MLSLFENHDIQQNYKIIRNKNYHQIKICFNSLNRDKTHFVNSNDICTPLDCVKEMVDSIPEEFWQRPNIKILDSCCGNGNFHAYIQTKTDLENLYFNEINQKRINNVKKYFGDNINLTEQDFLKFPCDQQFDLVVSNPPYAKFNENGRTSKNHNLARDFIKKALDITKENGYILFIVPNNWMSYSTRNILPKELTKYQFIKINIHGAKKWFPRVGSSFTWFLLHKIPNSKPFIVENNYVLQDQQIVKIDQNQNYIPLYLSQIVFQILNKTINNYNLPKYNIENSNDLHIKAQKQFLSTHFSKEFCYKQIHTPTQIAWANRPHKYQDGWKVFIALTNQYSTFIDNCGMTQSIAFIRCNSKEEANKIKVELDHAIYKFINNLTRYGNFNNISILRKFPILQSFNLTKEELDFIELFNKKYYQRKVIISHSSLIIN